MADIERIPSGPISENVRNMLVYICAKFGACVTKCTIGLLCCPTNYKALSSEVALTTSATYVADSSWLIEKCINDA